MASQLVDNLVSSFKYTSKRLNAAQLFKKYIGDLPGVITHVKYEIQRKYLM